MFPSLRLGFYLAPRPLVPIFQRISGAFLQGVPASIQAVLAAFIEEGHFATHLSRMRDIYRERHEAFHEAAQRLLGGLLETRRSVAGFHVTGRFPLDALDEEQVRARADAAGVIVSPIGRFCIEPVETKGLVLGVSAIDPRTHPQGRGRVGESAGTGGRREAAVAALTRAVCSSINAGNWSKHPKKGPTSPPRAQVSRRWFAIPVSATKGSLVAG